METSRSVSIRTSRLVLFVVLICSSLGTLMTGLLGASSEPTTQSGTGTQLIAETTTSGNADEHLSSLPGLIPSPPLLAGSRRWQMFTKYVGTSAESVCWSPDGLWLAVANGNADAWNPNGQLLASGSENKTICYWNADGSPGLIIEAHIGPVRGLQWNHQGTKLLSCDFGIESGNEQKEDQSHLKIWDVDGQLVSSVSVGPPLSAVCWSPGGTRVLAGSWRNTRMWVPGEPQSQIIIVNGSQNGRDGVVKIDGFVPVAWRPSGDLIAADRWLSV